MLREVQVDSSKRIQAGRKTPTASRGRQDSLAGPATEAQVELTFGNASGFVADTNGLRLQERAVDPKLPVGGNVYPAVTEAFGAQRRVLHFRYVNLFRSQGVWRAEVLYSKRSKHLETKLKRIKHTKRHTALSKA